jgi:hypothetical protein
MDDFHVGLVLLAFVVLRYKHDYAVLDKQIPKSSLHGITMPHAQNFGSSYGLTAGDVHQH